MEHPPPRRYRCHLGFGYKTLRFGRLYQIQIRHCPPSAPAGLLACPTYCCCCRRGGRIKSCRISMLRATEAESNAGGGGSHPRLRSVRCQQAEGQLPGRCPRPRQGPGWKEGDSSVSPMISSLPHALW